MLSCLLGIQDFENKTNKKIKNKKKTERENVCEGGLVGSSYLGR
jgi:hypothetical protein